jgi:hypothetical protein
MDNNLRYLDRARAEVIQLLTVTEPCLYHTTDGSNTPLLYNLSLTDLRLNTAIRIIAECVEKRVDLG